MNPTTTQIITNELNTLLDAAIFKVAPADQPTNPIDTLPMTQSEAFRYINQLIDDTFSDAWLIVYAEPDDIATCDVMVGDLIEIGHSAYGVIASYPDPNRPDNWIIETVRCSDGWQGRHSSSHIGKFVTLLAR